MIQMIFMSMMWLFISILSEVFATSMLPQTRHFRRFLPTAFCALGYFACFYSLSQAMQLMIPGVAYSFCCGMGVVFITVVGAAWYGQKVTLFEKTGIGLIVTGTLLMGFA